MLSDRQVIATVRQHLESKFPKTCPVCGRRYVSLADYLVRTTHLGDPVSADDPFEQVHQTSTAGAISYANCVCGSTLAMSSRGLDFWTMSQLMHWAARRMTLRGMSMKEVLRDLRSRIDEEVRREHDARRVGSTSPVD
jgi:hypothetical protein